MNTLKTSAATVIGLSIALFGSHAAWAQNTTATTNATTTTSVDGQASGSRPIGSGFGDGTTTAGTTNAGITVPGVSVNLGTGVNSTTSTQNSTFGGNSYGNGTFTTGNSPVPTGALNSGTPTGALDGGVPGASARTGTGVSGGAVAGTASPTPIQRGLAQ